MKRGKYFFVIFLLISGFLLSANAGTILVTNVLSNSVTLLDEETLLKIKEIKTGYRPHEIIVSLDGKYAIVSNFGDLAGTFPGETLTVIDIAKAKVLQTIKLPDRCRPHGLALFSDTQVLVTAQGIQSLLLVDFVKGVIDEYLSLPGDGAHMVITDAEKHYAYVSNVNSGSVIKFNLKTMMMVDHVVVGKETEGITLAANENLLLVTDRANNELIVLRTKDMQVIKRIKTDSGPVRVQIFDHDNEAVITNTLSGNVQIVNLCTLSVTQSYKTTYTLDPLPVPINIHVNANKNTGYITNSFANNIILMDLRNGTILKLFKTARMPDGITFSSINAMHVENLTDALFVAGPININADIESVWRISKKLEDYNRMSHGAVTADIDGTVEPGKMIRLFLYKDTWKGKFIPPSDEIITVVDNSRKILAWTRKLPDGDSTERYQLLEKTSDNKTRSIIVLHIPGILGATIKTTLGKTINNALSELNNGIKMEAEASPS